ncbi:MAG: TonB-dependent receptor plug domain-containing protein [Bacteroidales bacterium]|jgi:iron complex outermembrane receptor protein|nr:TonB-dependent receptor plug domain-containing protein [Bacteroidales bacterium]
MKHFFSRWRQKILATFLLGIFGCFFLAAQPKPVEQLTREDILSMSFDELSVYPLEDIVRIAGIVGVSIDDLFNMLLNKEVSIASKHDENYFDTPLSTSVLTAEDIERSGALSIPEALRLLPGVIVREKTNGNYDVQLRSNVSVAGQQSLFAENTLTLIMIDGRTVYTYTTGGTFWEMLAIGLGDIERIEVIRGASSVMYGANAVTGVINIITKKSSPDKLSVEARTNIGGLFDGATSPVGGTGTKYLSALFNVNEKWTFRVSGNFNYRDRAQSDIFFYTVDPYGASQTSEQYYPVDSVIIHGADPRKMFRDPNRALQSYSANGLASYRLNDRIHFDLTAGVQNSTAISSNMDLNFFAHTERHTQTRFANLRSEIHDFSVLMYYTWGWGDLACGMPGLRSDVESFHFNVEYNYRWEKLNINPGFNFAYNTLNGDPYFADNQSFFKGKQLLRSFAPSVRLDYRPFDKLRFIGGLRLENNKTPRKNYLTWQLVANYKFNETSIVRAVYSRANRSPFMIDVNANSSTSIKADRRGTLYTELRMEGDKNLKLVVADMYELGYRRKIGKHILLNFELFRSQIKDLNAAALKELRVHVDPSDLQLIADGKQPVNPIVPNFLNYKFENIREVQMQTGGTVELGVVVNSSLNFRFWGTVQQTSIMDHNNNAPTLNILGNSLRWEAAYSILTSAHSQYSTDGDGNYRITSDDIAPDYIDMTSKATPVFYGGYEMNWQFAKRFSFFSNGYGFTQHSFSNQFFTPDISGKMLVNGKISCLFVENATIFLSVNNILNQTSPEFGFMDRVGTQWYLGLNIKL